MADGFPAICWFVIIVIVIGVVGSFLPPTEYEKTGSTGHKDLLGRNTYYVYGLKAVPNKKFGDVYFYIGYTNNPARRLKEHRNDGGWGTTHKAAYIRRVQEQGGKIEMDVLGKRSSKDAIRKLEKSLIRKHGLTNMKVG